MANKQAAVRKQNSLEDNQNHVANRSSAYFQRHSQAFLSSLGRLFLNPVSSLLTLAVIAIAITLPTFLYVVLKNTEHMTQGWDSNGRISLYLKTDTTQAQAKMLVQQVRDMPKVGSVRYISAAEGLSTFERQSGFHEILQQLDSNPIPAVIQVEPKTHVQDSKDIQALVEQLRTLRQVDLAQLDMQWLQRLYAIINVVESSIYMLAFFLGLGVLLIVGNTIRMTIQNYHDEIETIKLVGGTDAFIRRPFLYTGTLYGALGGFMALVMVFSTLLLIQPAVNHLTGLYQSHFHTQGLGFLDGITLLGLSGLLGFLGAWFAVNRHLLMVEPT